MPNPNRYLLLGRGLMAGPNCCCLIVPGRSADGLLLWHSAFEAPQQHGAEYFRFSTSAARAIALDAGLYENQIFGNRAFSCRSDLRLHCRRPIRPLSGLIPDEVHADGDISAVMCDALNGNASFW